jgi:hypothetical protein
MKDNCTRFIFQKSINFNKTKNKIISFFPLILFCILAFVLCTYEGCKSPTAPKDNNPQDTTSNNFVWQVDTIGAEGSVLYDVTIINDTLAYAVGELFPRDSNGQSNQTDLHNAAVWNGKTWTMIKVPYNYMGTSVYNPIHTVFAVSSSDIYFGGNGLEHWDGHQFSNVEAVNPYWQGHLMQKIWANSDNNIYIVGDGGTCVHYDGSWHSIQTGTTLPFQDIWGDGGQVLATASDKFGLGGKYLISLNGNMATILNDSIPTAVSLSGIWFKANQKYFLVGDGIFEDQSLVQRNWQFDTFSWQLKYYTFAVRGNSVNDVFTSGDAGTLAHWNGKVWTAYLAIQNTTDGLRSISMKGNTVIAVGERYIDGIHYYGVIYAGRR